MATFHRDNCGEQIYVFAVDKGAAKRFAKRRGLRNFVPASRVEDLPRKNGMVVILVGKYWLNEDCELLFSPGGLLYDFRAEIYYDTEVPALH